MGKQKGLFSVIIDYNRLLYNALELEIGAKKLTLIDYN